MNKEDFLSKISEVLEVENNDAISFATEFKTLEEWSSISIMLLIAFYDEEFSKEVTPAEIKGCVTIEDLFNLSIA